MKWKKPLSVLALLCVLGSTMLSACTAPAESTMGTTQPPAATNTVQPAAPATEPEQTTAATTTAPLTTRCPSMASSAVKARQTSRKTTRARTTTKAAVKPISRTVYITRTGKRYHYSSHCNGGTYYASTLDEASSRGLTPCQKCVG